MESKRDRISTLALSGLCKSFAGLKAVDDVSFDLKTGEILGLIGPNGSGKTTLINVVTGLLPATAGTVSIDGEVATGKPAFRVAKMGLARTFQTIRLFKDLSVLENVEAASVSMGKSRRQARPIAMELLREMGLESMADRIASEIPFGHQRKLEIARALATDPKFLLLDEPAAGLNEEESDLLLALLNEILATKPVGILIVDHDMRLMMNLCDRLHVLDYGKTIAHGTPDEIRRDPQVMTAYLGSSA